MKPLVNISAIKNLIKVKKKHKEGSNALASIISRMVCRRFTASFVCVGKTFHISIEEDEVEKQVNNHGFDKASEIILWANTLDIAVPFNDSPFIYIFSTYLLKGLTRPVYFVTLVCLDLDVQRDAR